MPRKRYRLHSWFERHPLITLAVGIAGLGAIAIWEIVRIAAARHSVPSGWAAGLAGGVAAGLAMTSALIIMYSLLRRAPRKIGGAAWLVTVLIGVSPALVFVATAPQPGPGSAAPYVVTTAGAVAGMAYAAMFCTLYLALAFRAVPRVIRSPRPAPTVTHRRLVTALIGPREEGWDVSWTGDGRCPRRLSAATLTEITDQAAAAVLQLYARDPAEATNADLQIALLPHDYSKGPIFDISGGPGAFTATDKFSGRILHGRTLEDLLDAADAANDSPTRDYMFHWIRPVTALSLGPSAAGLEPAS